MANSDLLYVRNMTLSESENEEDELGIWDDRKLNVAYDKALSIANAEVAKRLAMSTNTQESKDGSKSKKSALNESAKSQKKDKTKWKAGMHCRAVYEVDGVEYEAFLMRIINDKECVVRFLGYENSEIVPVSSLKPSLGKSKRTQQIEDALAENLGDDLSNHGCDAEDMDCSNRPQSTGSTASLNQTKKSSKKKNHGQTMHGLNLPDIAAMPMPNLAHLGNIGVMDMPIPPPPPLSLSRADVESEDQAVSSMLLSWYMSGYYTGLYQGMKRAREGRRNN